jgi:hypothetical protein
MAFPGVQRTSFMLAVPMNAKREGSAATTAPSLDRPSF